MSTGGYIGAGIGAVIGGTMGFITGGPVGAIYWGGVGAGIGAGLGMIVDPMAMDTADPGGPNMGDLDISGPEEGAPIADLLGCTKITANLLWYGDSRSEEIESESSSGGKGGGGSSSGTVVGYKYYLSMAMGICQGPIDTLYAVYADNEPVWGGEVDLSALNSITISLYDYGNCTIYTGRNNQSLTPPASLISRMVAMGANANYIPMYKNLCWAYMDDICVGTYNRAPSFRFVVGKRPEITAVGAGRKLGYDYNASHAVYYILNTMAGLPAAYFDSTSFGRTAMILAAENRGISILFDNAVAALTYIEGINSHVDSFLRYETDGKFHFYAYRKLADTTVLDTITEEYMTDDLQLTRRDWSTTINEMKVQFPERVWQGTCVGETPVVTVTESVEPTDDSWTIWDNPEVEDYS
jgi:hypothetical protein